MSEIVIYKDGGFSIEISVEKETLWLSAEQIATVFDVNRPAIVKHIGNIYKTDELDKDSTCSILEHVAKDGKNRKMNFYNLDMIIATGYRVNSKKATFFRRWATNILKDYLLEGYSLNQKRLQQKGMKEFQEAIALLETTIKQDTLACDEAKFTRCHRGLWAFLVVVRVYEAMSYALYFGIKYDFKVEDNLFEIIDENRDTILMLLAYLHDKIFINHSRVNKEYKQLAKSLMDDIDEYWVFVYEVLTEGVLKEEWKIMKKEKISFLSSHISDKL